MKCSDVPAAAFGQRLGGQGIWLEVSSWCFHIRTSEASVARGLYLLYRDYAVGFADPGFADFHVRIRRPANLRRWLGKQVTFELDGERPFEPFPLYQALPMLEWGMNWCVSSSTSHMLVLHSAVIEREGKAIVMPAPPGHGKSTLCAALVASGWRLLSDELALLDLTTGLLHPAPRPISLKNRSIEVIRKFSPTATLSDSVRDTVKGEIAYMRAPQESVHRAEEPAVPAWVIFPRYREGGEARFQTIPRADAFKSVAEQSFNYYTLGRHSFNAVAALMDRCECFQFEYEFLPAAVSAFNILATASKSSRCGMPS